MQIQESHEAGVFRFRSPTGRNIGFVVVSLSCSASGAGGPGSLAGSKVSVTVPSITVTITGVPVLQL